MEYYENQLKIYEEINHKIGIAQVLGNIGLIYYYLKDYEKAISTCQKSMKNSEALGSKREVSTALCNIGLAYHGLRKYEKAINAHKKSLLIAEELNDQEGISRELINIGHVYKSQKKYGRAKEQYNIAGEKLDKYNIDYLLPEYLIEKAELAFLQKNLPEAKRCNLEGLKIAQKMGNEEYINKGKLLEKKIKLV
jgi:tetratricopeptide (TPR) repeat protein